jgi:hypothetical protein
MGSLAPHSAHTREGGYPAGARQRAHNLIRLTGKARILSVLSHADWTPAFAGVSGGCGFPSAFQGSSHA